MTINLTSRLHRLSFAGVCLVGAALYLGWAMRPLMGSLSAASLQRGSLLKAVAWEGGNAEHHARLGRFYMFVAQDTPAALKEYRTATALNPHMARYWLDLANANQFTGDIGGQKHALEHAIEADPNTPEVAWEVANFYVLQGDAARALAQFRVVLAADPYKVRQALKLCWHVTDDPELIASLLPPDPEEYLEFVQLLVSRDEGTAASRVWDRMIALGKPLDPKLTFFYFEYLLRKHEVGRARRAWQELASVAKSLEPETHVDNLIVNGGFTGDILDGGFDWQYRSTPGVTLAIDTTEFHNGSRSLALTFDGTGNDAGLWQVVPVERDADYEFSAFVKAEDLYSASPPRFAIADAYNNAPITTTDEIVGTSGGWQQVRSKFRTRSDTNLVTLRIVRLQGDTRIRGKLWLDDVSLVRK